MENSYIHLLNAFPLPAPFLHFNIIKMENQNLAFHSHENRYHINLITKGSIKVRLKDSEFNVTEGQVFIIPPDIMHQLISDTGYNQIGMDISNIDDENGLVEEIRNICGGKATRVHLETTKISEYITESTLLDISKISSLKCISAMTTLLISIIECTKNNTDSKSFKNKFIAAAEQCAQKGSNLNELCKTLNFSKTHLERLAKQEFGCSAMKYIEHLRYLNICSLLTNTDKKLDVIAKECGFCNSSHLSVFFKKHSGISPVKYRNNQIK
ncbi:MAG: AraC family transcriptional regulator [Clostridia bacterium]|nr:AraC family transcriptional regulator [Clostridia bacterium]